MGKNPTHIIPYHIHSSSQTHQNHPEKKMPIFSAAVASLSGVASLSHLFTNDSTSHSHRHHPPPPPPPSSSPSSFSSFTCSSFNFPNFHWNSPLRRHPFLKVSVSDDAKTEAINQAAAPNIGGAVEDSATSAENVTVARRSADWETAKLYKEKGLIYEGRIEASNAGGLIVRFHSIFGFLPYRQLSSSKTCKEPNKTIQEIGEAMSGSPVSVKVIEVDQKNRKLIFSEKEAMWSKFSQQINVGDIFEGMVTSVEDYGAFVDLRFPDGSYRLSGLVHVSEVSWDLVQDVRDVLIKGDEVRVKVTRIDRGKSRIILSIKQLEEDPLLETLDKVIPLDGSVYPSSSGGSNMYNIEPLPGLEAICEELLKEEGINDVRISRQGFEKRVVSQDLQLWLSNAPAIGRQFTLLARAGRQVQEIQLTTSLDQEGIKRALQRVLERVP